MSGWADGGRERHHVRVRLMPNWRVPLIKTPFREIGNTPAAGVWIGIRRSAALFRIKGFSPQPCAEVAMENRGIYEEREWPRAREFFHHLEVAPFTIRFERFEKSEKPVVEITIPFGASHITEFDKGKFIGLRSYGGGNRFVEEAHNKVIGSRRAGV